MKGFGLVFVRGLAVERLSRSLSVRSGLGELRQEDGALLLIRGFLRG